MNDGRDYMNTNRILVRFVSETGQWQPWDCMTELEWDGGGDFPKLDEDWPQRTLWIRFSQDDVDKILNRDEVEGTVIPDR